MSNEMPSQIRLTQKKLILNWNDGIERTLESRCLRRACRCSDCLAQTEKPDLEDLSIVEIRLIGSHAVNIGFSDGHARGIFPFTYLCELAQ